MACGAKNNALKGEVLNPSYAINSVEGGNTKNAYLTDQQEQPESYAVSKTSTTGVSY